MGSKKKIEFSFCLKSLLNHFKLILKIKKKKIDIFYICFFCSSHPGPFKVPDGIPLTFRCWLTLRTLNVCVSDIPSKIKSFCTEFRNFDISKINRILVVISFFFFLKQFDLSL